MSPVVVPNLDPLPLPAPVWLLQVLLYLTFVLHIIPMNMVLGGGVFAVITAWMGRRNESPNHTRLADQIAHVLPVATAAAITLGVPPLLFVQTLYGPLFYTSSVLIAWPWLSVVALLMVAYYGYYYFLNGKDADGRRPIWAGLVASILFVVIGFLYSNNMTLMMQPEKFAPMYQQHAHGLMLNLSDPLLYPRYLHFFVGAVAVSSLMVMIIGLTKRRQDADFSQWVVRVGGLTFIVATLLQTVIGIWQLLALKREVMMLFMGRDVGATAIFLIAVALAVVGLVLILLAARGKAPVALTIAGAAATVGTIVLMAIMRGIVRTAYLGQNFVVDNQPVSANWPVVVLFALLLVGGLAVVIWMVTAVMTRRGMAAT